MSYGTSGTSGDGIPVIIKNKIVYGLVDRTVQAYDLGVADYNALSEEEQLDGNIRFIQGVNASAYQSTNSVWAKLGTTPLAEGLPADCSQAINQIKSNLTDYTEYQTSEVVVGKWIDGKTIYRKCFSVTTPASTGTTAEVVNIESLNYENAVALRFVLTTTSNSITTDGAQDIKVFIRKKVTSLSLNADCLCLNTSVAGYTSKSGTIIFEYTKVS